LVFAVLTKIRVDYFFEKEYILTYISSENKRNPVKVRSGRATVTLCLFRKGSQDTSSPPAHRNFAGKGSGLSVPFARTPLWRSGFFIFRWYRKIKRLEILPELEGMVWVDSKDLLEDGFDL
jgi:hypothetical protein